MRWYDYLVCLFLADVIAAMLIAGSPFVVLPVLAYLSYEDLRRIQVHGDEE